MHTLSIHFHFFLLNKEFLWFFHFFFIFFLSSLIPLSFICLSFSHLFWSKSSYWVKKEYLYWVMDEIKGTRSSLFKMKWIESISWFRLNITDLTVYNLSHHLKFYMMWQYVHCYIQEIKFELWNGQMERFPNGNDPIPK